MLSLDAPLVAALWQNVFAREAHVSLSWASQATLPATVWLIYLVDRLLDTTPGRHLNCTARHSFCGAHRKLYLAFCCLCVLLLSISVISLPDRVVTDGSYLMGAVVAYFIVVHLGAASWRIPFKEHAQDGRGVRRALCAKEFAVGVVFGAGTALAPFSWAPHSRSLLFGACLFGLLCWLNTAAIEVWEGGQVDRVSGWLVRNMRPLCLSIALLCTLLFLFRVANVSTVALLISSLGYWTLADLQPRLGPDGLRVAIDAPLLSPLLVFGMR